MIYFDTTYLVRLYRPEAGSLEVQRLAAGAECVASANFGRAETAAALHRHLREGSLTPDEFEIVMAQFEGDCQRGAFRWLPLSEEIAERTARAYRSLPGNQFLRGADAVHLATAAIDGFTSIHSNDTKMLAAAPHFGLTGVHVI